MSPTESYCLRILRGEIKACWEGGQLFTLKSKGEEGPVMKSAEWELTQALRLFR